MFGRPTKVRFLRFEILIEREPEDEGYAAFSPTLPGCFGNGLTIEEAKRSIRTAVEQHVQTLFEHGQAIPQNE